MVVKKEINVDLLLQKWKKKINETVVSSEVYTLYSDLYDVLNTYRIRELQERCPKPFSEENYIVEDIKKATVYANAHELGDPEHKKTVVINYSNFKDPKLEIINKCNGKKEVVIRIENPDVQMYVRTVDDEM